MFVKWKATAAIKWVNCFLASTLVASIIFVPIARGLSTVDEREARKLFGGYRITPKFCRASKTLPASDPRSRGPTICMFNHECAQRNGEVVGACMDGFLFGACCQIPGEIEDSLLHLAQKPQVLSNSAAALSYESYGGQQPSIAINNRPNQNQEHIENDYISPTGSYFDTGSDFENEATNDGYVQNNNFAVEEQKIDQFYVNHDSVMISSPSSTISSIESGSLSNEQNYSPEIPGHISTQQYSTTYEENVDVSRPTQSMNTHKSPSLFDQEGEFSHSDITHPGAESELIEENQQFSSDYGQSTLNVPSSTTEISSSSIASVSTHSGHFSSQSKPTFKPKPTVQTEPQTQNQENYVLVQTITKDKNPFKQQIEGITTSDIESIESIILMLNDTNHGPSYNVNNASPNPDRVVYTSTPPGKPTSSPSMTASDKYGNNGFYITTIPPPLSTVVTSTRPPITKKPISSTQSTSYEGLSVSSPYPSTSSFSPTRPVTNTRPSILVFSSTTSRPSAHYGFSSTSQRPSRPGKPSQNNEVVITPTKGSTIARPTKVPKPPTYSFVSVPTKPSPNFFTKRPGSTYTIPGTKVPKLPSTSYVTGPTTPRPRPPTPSLFGSSSSISHLNTIDQDFSSTSSSVHSSSYGYDYSSSTQKIPLQQAPSAKPQRPQFVKIPATQRPPSPTIIITPKPTSTAATSSPWAKLPPVTTASTSENYPTSSYVISSSRPDPINNTFPGLQPVDSNDFDDPGYFDGTKTPSDQITTEGILTPRPQDDRPGFPGYYGPTPTYSTFNIPVAPEDEGTPEEETYTSPNDFVNFPPVRNPNLNMSATSSAVTYDLDMSTPAFVEDEILKDKMNMLVNKIVQSLQGNFNVLADIIEERNSTIYQDVDRPTARPQIPTRRPATTKIPQTKPTKAPQTLSPTKQPTKRPATGNRPSTPIRGTTTRPPGTRKPTVVTKKPTVTKRPTPKPLSTGTKKPPNGQTTKRPTKPPKRVSTTTAIYDEDETPDVEENEVETGAVTEGVRRFQCGVRPHVKSGRIVGGKGATFGEWPWQVLVRESTWLGLFTKNKCGGVLITNKFVVTAAHCQPGFLASLVAVFGEFDISGDLEAKRSVTKNVRRVIVHRQYDAATFENDLALLELESAIHYDTHIVPICMPPDTADFTGRMATVTGWGRLKYGGGVPSVLQEVQVPIIENSVCQEMFHTAGHNKKILPSFLCAGYANGQKDSCEGDSGGPLVLQRNDGRWELAGTVSHGIKCAAPYLPGVYMRTTYYKPWLKSITGIK